MSEIDKPERRIELLLTTGEAIVYRPAHRPLERQEEDCWFFWWGEEDGSLTSLAVNLKGIAALEMKVRREDTDEKGRVLIDMAKCQEQ